MMMRGHERRHDPEFALRCYYEALQKFEECLDSNRNNKVVLRNCGHALEYIHFEEDSKERGRPANQPERLLSFQCSGRLQRANNYFRAALRAEVLDAQTHLLYARFLHRFGQTVPAEQHYLTSVELDPHYVDALLHYGHFLQEKGESTAAELFYARAVSCQDRIPQPHAMRLSAEEWNE